MPSLYKAGQSIRQIAAALDRAPSSSLSRAEAQQRRQVGYKPGYAQEQARARRWTGSRLERNAELRGLVLGQLRLGWSPEQIAGRLRQQNAATTISHESIYRFIYAQIRRTNDGAWRHYLPKGQLQARLAEPAGAPATTSSSAVFPSTCGPTAVEHRTPSATGKPIS